MKPPLNPFPPKPANQFQPNGGTATVNPQVFSTNPSQANSCNMLQNSMPMQPQLGLINPQIPMPFNNSNTHSGNNGQTMPNLPPFIAQQPGLMINPNHLGMLQMGQCHVGFPPQNQVNNLHTIPLFLNQVNPCQLPGQIFAPNFSNLPQQFNPNMGFPNLQNPLQNMNPVVSLQMPNPSQIPSIHQAVGPQNPNFFANPLFGVEQQVNLNQQNFGMPTTGANSSKPMPIATRLVPGNSSALQQTQNSQPSAFNRPQGNPVKNGQSNTSNFNRKNFPGKDLTKNPKKEASQLGYQKSQFHHSNNRKRKFGFSNEQRGKGCGYERAAKTSRTNPADQAREKKRSLGLIYTEQEIKKWCEERRRNYPSKANIEKKQTEKLSDSNVIDREAKLRCEQLKEILAKQAELGVEVAEIPSYYLLDSENRVHGREDNRKSLTNKGRHRNRYGKRGRYNKKDQLAKQQMQADKDSSNISSLNKKKLTLLQKLLSPDIRRDKRRLLHAFRFMVVNSFFKDWPEKPLKFPLVVVKEDGREDDVVKEKYTLDGKGVSEIINKTTVENFGDDGDSGEDEGDNNENKAKLSFAGDDGKQRGTCFSMKKGSIVGKVYGTEAEEGEIID